jgi:Ca2+-binding RTX toxin-like protein
MDQTSPPATQSAISGNDSTLPIQLAQTPPTLQQTTGTPAASAVGQVKTLDGAVTVVRADGSREALQIGDHVFQGDKIETGKDGKAGIVFTDGSTFSIGNDGAFTIDQLVYDPNAGDGKSVFSITTGIFSYVSGAIAKSGDDAATVNTPVATIGIRGTTVVGRASQEGSENTITLLRDSDGALGEIAIINLGGQRILTSPFELYTLFSRNALPGESKVIDQPEFDRIFGNGVVIIPSQPPQQFAGDNNPTPGHQETAFQVVEVQNISLDGAVRDAGALRRLAARFRRAEELEEDDLQAEIQEERGQDDEPDIPVEPDPPVLVGADAPSATAGNISGPESTSVALVIAAALVDASETLTVQITGVPTGGSLSATAIDRGAPAVVDETNGVWTVTNADLSTLVFIPPTSSAGNYNMTLVATSDTGTETASTSVDFTASISNNLLIGTTAADTLAGTALDEVIFGDADNDVLSGGDGNDNIQGWDGDDTIMGENGIDILYGGAGNDDLDGGDGNDTLSGDGGDDNLVGGNNDDTFLFSDDGGVNSVSGGSGTDTIGATATQNITLTGMSAADAVEQVNGHTSGTTIHGDDAASILDFSNVTLSNISEINGGLGDDTITGTSSGNVLSGGSDGADTLTGDIGIDTFKLATGGIDHVTNFDVGQGDILDLADLVTLPSGGDINDFIQIQDSGGDSTVSFSATAGGALQQIAVLDGLTGLNVTTLFSGENIVVTEL